MRLRAQLGQELLALIGIAVGVALLFAALVANTSLTGSVERATNGVVGDARYQLAARGDGFDERKLQAVRRLPGVAGAAPMLEVRARAALARARRRSVLLIGVTPRLRAARRIAHARVLVEWLANVRALALPTPLARSLGLTLGQHGRAERRRGTSPRDSARSCRARTSAPDRQPDRDRAAARTRRS